MNWCGCESALCDHGILDGVQRCTREPDPRIWCLYIGDICTQCAANMGASGGQEFLFLRCPVPGCDNPIEKIRSTGIWRCTKHPIA